MRQRRSFTDRLGPRGIRVAFNLWPAIRGTGVRVTHIAPDWSEVRVRLPLSWRTRNYVGTIFGGSLYGATDPFLMLILLHRLGDGYVVWDKAATIHFRRPAKRTLYGTYTVDDELLDQLRARADQEGAFDWRTTVRLTDSAGTVYAEAEKVLYIATAQAYAARRRERGEPRSSGTPDR